MRVRFSWADYAHDEVLDTGELSATFLNEAFETRAELVGAPRGVWRSTSGVQYGSQRFSVKADASLLPPTQTDRFALLNLHEFNLAPLRIDAALQFETKRIAARADLALGNAAARGDFSGLSGSLGASYAFVPGWVIAGDGFFSTRAPVVEELFTQGTDPGVQGGLLGNRDLAQETAWGFEAVVRGFGPRWSIEASACDDRSPDYIFTAHIGDVVAGLPVFRFLADQAEYYAFEVQGKVDLLSLGGAAFGADALIDYTRATLSDGSPVPQIPPLQMLGGLGARSRAITASVEIDGTVPRTARALSKPRRRSSRAGSDVAGNRAAHHHALPDHRLRRPSDNQCRAVRR